MQALEKIGVLEKDEEKGGRRITQSGQRDLGKSQFHNVWPFRRQRKTSMAAAPRYCHESQVFTSLREDRSRALASLRPAFALTVLIHGQTELRRPQLRPRKKKMMSRYIRMVVVWEWSFGHT